MRPVRVGAGVARKQEKGSFVIPASVSAAAEHSQHLRCSLRNEPHTSKRRMKGSEGGRGTEKQRRKTGNFGLCAFFQSVIAEMYGVVTAGFLYLHGAADLCQRICLLIHNK